MQRLSFFTGLVLLLITGMASVLVTPMTADAQTPPDPTIEWVKIYTNPTAGATAKTFDYMFSTPPVTERTGYVFPMDSNGELNAPGVREVRSDDVVLAGTQIGIAIRLTNVTYANGSIVIDIGNTTNVAYVPNDDLDPKNPLHDEFIFPDDADDQAGGPNDTDENPQAVTIRDWTLVYLYTLPTTHSGKIEPRFYPDPTNYPTNNRYVFIYGSGGSGGGNKYSSVGTESGYFKRASGAAIRGPYPQARHVAPVRGIQLVDAAGTPLTRAPRLGKSRMIQSVSVSTTHGYSTLRLEDIAADNCAYFGVGDDVNFKVEFGTDMTASGTDKSLRLRAHLGNNRGVDSPKALLADGDGTQELTFRYTVAQGDNSIGLPLEVSYRFHESDSRNANPALKIRTLSTGTQSFDFISWRELNSQLKYDFYRLPRGTSPASVLHPNRRTWLVDGIQPSVRLLGVVTPQTHTMDTGFLNEPIGRNPQFAADSQAALALVRDNPDRQSPHLQQGEFQVDLRVYNYGIDDYYEGFGEGREAIVAEEVELEASDITLEPASGAAADWDVQIGYIGLDHRRLDGSESNWPRWLCYRVGITPPKDFEGNVGISVPADATQDIAGNRNQASNTLTVTVDTAAPRVIEAPKIVARPSEAYTGGDELTVEVSFDEAGVTYEGDNPPYVVFYLGERVLANARHATWQKGSEREGSTIVPFVYPIRVGDLATSLSIDERGILIPTGTRVVDGDGNELLGQAPPAVAPTEPVTQLPAATGTDERLPFPPTIEGAALTFDISETPVVTYVPILEPTEEPRSPASDVPRSPIVFNELGNGSGAENDWLELRNVTGDAVSLKDWELSVVQDGKKEDTSLIVFPDVSVPANGLLLITHSDPTAAGNVLAGGDDVSTADVEQKGSPHRYLVADGLSLPDDGQFLLILRKAKEKLGLDEAFVDVAGGGGSDTDAFVREQTGDYDTYVWPLQVLEAPESATEDALSSGKVWQRAKADIVGYHRDAWAEASFTGLGYDRNVSKSAATAGTPGYPNVAAKEAAAKGSVTFSEIMVDSAGGTLPQWIELYNNSKTDVLNLNRWELEIQNVDSEDLVGRPIVRLTLQEKLIQPNQTLLIVTGDARAASADVFPEDRVYNLLELHDKNLRIKRPQDTFLSAEGFYLRLTDRNEHLVDEIGNTDGNRRTDDAPAWALAMSAEEGVRSSLIRRYTDGTSEATDGTEKAGWVLAANVKKVVDGALHWGASEDIGTPGYRQGGALPVELSSFTVTRLESGSVIVTWTTESEVDNAGFNLRRSLARDSGFTLINPALIAGAGTTGERQEYTFTDTSAKPGVEYYYQIEEVSFDGKRETLAMRMLRGPVSAANRALTTFGAVKQKEK